MAVTVRDVAAEAGVSFQLVAAVLGGKKYAHASEATRKRIMDASEKLGYVPNASARILRGNASMIIGVLIDSRAPESAFSIIGKFEQAAALRGYRILITQAHDDPGKLFESYKFLKQNGVDGIVSFSHDYPLQNYHLDQFLKNDPRIVFVFNSMDQNENDSYVDVDRAGGMKTAMKHILDNGYRNPALILLNYVSENEKLTQSRQKRIEGFRNCAPPDSKVYFIISKETCAEEIAEQCRKLIHGKILPDRVDTVIAQDDNLAAILMKELLAAGIRIPQDIGLIGWDNLLIGQCLPVTLTTLYFDKKQLAESALQILLDKIDGKTDPVRISFPLNLIVRESTCRNSGLKD